MSISKRIEFLVSEIDKGFNAFYDIGCDHGKIGLEILKNNTTVKVVFCDISKKNLLKAQMLCDLKNIDSSRVDFICCDGVPSNVPSCSVGLIFGLGGETIIHILDKCLNMDEFYLQPSTSVVNLRKYLSNSSFDVLKDYLFYDGVKFYDFLHIKRLSQKNHLSKEEILLGKDNLNRKDELYLNYLRKELHNLSKVLAKINQVMVNYNINRDKIQEYYDKYCLITSRLKGEINV